jgi:hypothetical protein
MLNNVIQMLWVEGDLSVMERVSIGSFLKHGHEVHLYTYGRVGKVPYGTALMDANEIIPERNLFKVRGGYSSFSDFFRWKLVRDRGGWYCDADTICLKRFDFPRDYVFVGGFGKPGSDDCVSSGMFRAPANSPIMEWGWQECLKMKPETMSWGQAGPPLFTEGVHGFDLTGSIICGSMFFPVFYTEAPHAFTDIYVPRISESCYSIHLFNEMWRLAGADKNAMYPESSLYERLKREFL